MDNHPPHAPRCTAFDGYRLVTSGTYLHVAFAIRALLGQNANAPVLVFDDNTGAQIDFDLRGTDQDLSARLSGGLKPNEEAAARGPGRPKLGVAAREVTLLPRHWEWLAEQPGGASVTLRKLVEEARRAGAFKDVARTSQERAYRFMSAMAGNLPGFEEAARALFANDRQRLNELMAAWPIDVRDHAIMLAFKAGDQN
jgi:uncharacterized protein